MYEDVSECINYGECEDGVEMVLYVVVGILCLSFVFFFFVFYRFGYFMVIVLLGREKEKEFRERWSLKDERWSGNFEMSSLVDVVVMKEFEIGDLS